MVFSPLQMVGFLGLAAIAAFCGIWTIRAYLKNKNPMIGWFSGYFFCKAIGFGIISMLGMLTVKSFDLIYKGTLVGFWITCLAPGFILLIALSGVRLRFFPKIPIFLAVALIGTLSIIMTIPAVVMTVDPITGFVRMDLSRDLPFQSLMFGIYHFIFYIPIVLSFFYFFVKAEERKIRIRSLLFGIGYILATIGAFVICFTMMGMIKMPPGGTAFAGITYMVILAGILYKPKKTIPAAV